MIKIYVKDDILDMLMIKELSKVFKLVYKFDIEPDIYIENKILHIKEFPLDLDHWTKELHKGRGRNFAYFILDTINEYDDLVSELIES